MVIVKIAGQEAPQVGLAEDHHLIQTLPPDTPNHSLGTRILPGALWGGQDLVDVQVRGTSLKACAIRGIPVPEQILRGRVPGEGLDELSRHPLRAIDPAGD